MTRNDKMRFNKNIFINCPFDDEYKPLLRPLIFTIIDCGFTPRIASESSDGGEVRMEKIKRLIQESCYSIHDISRIEPLKKNDLPRFNMPFELGLDLGCKHFGTKKTSRKKCLILEKEKYRYQKVLSDISGNDIKSHNNNSETLVHNVRSWIRESASKSVPSPNRIWLRYNEFYADFQIATKNEFSETAIRKMPTSEFIEYIKDWKSNNPLN